MSSSPAIPQLFLDVPGLRSPYESYCAESEILPAIYEKQAKNTIKQHMKYPAFYKKGQSIFDLVISNLVIILSLAIFLLPTKLNGFTKYDSI